MDDDKQTDLPAEREAEEGPADQPVGTDAGADEVPPAESIEDQ